MAKDKISKKQYLEHIRFAIEHEFAYCYICEKPIFANELWSLDHVFPKEKGGPNCISNLKPTHRFCNNLKRSYSLAEIDEKRNDLTRLEWLVAQKHKQRQ